MHNILSVRANELGIYVKRSGAFSIMKVADNTLIIANPSEVLAHDDQVKVDMDLTGDYKLTDQAFSKVISNSNITLDYSVSSKGNLLFVPKPILFYNNARAKISNTFTISGSARIVEVYILGRSGHGEKFANGKISSVTKIYSEKRELIAYDTFAVEDLSWQDSTLMGENCLLTSYDVENGKVDVEKKLFGYSRLEREAQAYLAEFRQ